MEYTAQDFISFFATNRDGFLTIILVLFASVIFVQWVAWIWGWGRFRHKTNTRSDGQN